MGPRDTLFYLCLYLNKRFLRSNFKKLLWVPRHSVLKKQLVPGNEISNGAKTMLTQLAKSWVLEKKEVRQRG